MILLMQIVVRLTRLIVEWPKNMGQSKAQLRLPGPIRVEMKPAGASGMGCGLMEAVLEW
jgi:hypothetical protein